MSGEFTPTLVASLQRRMAQAAPRWSLPPKTPQQILSISENVTLLMGDPAQPRSRFSERPMTVRLHRSGYHSAQEIRSELAWIEALRAEKVVSTPGPRLAHDGQALQVLPDRDAPGGKRHAVAFDWVAGQNPDPASEDLTPWFAILGRLTARLHNHAQSWQRPAFFTRKAWTLDSILGPKALWGPWQAAVGLDADGHALLGQACAAISERLTAYGQDAARFGLIHGDLRLANLLVHDKTLQVIDFDDCGFSWFLFDFAAAISFHELDPAVPAWQDAWLSGYQEVRPLTAEDLAILPSLIMMRRLQLSAWLASHHEIPLAQQLGARFTEGTVAMARAYLG
jgi:Ser/Thr protein kinase RdoA (MazF antagonist)